MSAFTCVPKNCSRETQNRLVLPGDCAVLRSRCHRATAATATTLRVRSFVPSRPPRVRPPDRARVEQLLTRRRRNTCRSPLALLASRPMMTHLSLSGGGEETVRVRPSAPAALAQPASAHPRAERGQAIRRLKASSHLAWAGRIVIGWLVRLDSTSRKNLIEP